MPTQNIESLIGRAGKHVFILPSSLHPCFWRISQVCISCHRCNPFSSVLEGLYLDVFKPMATWSCSNKAIPQSQLLQAIFVTQVLMVIGYCAALATFPEYWWTCTLLFGLPFSYIAIQQPLVSFCFTASYTC